MATVYPTPPAFRFVRAEVELVRNQTAQASNSRASDILKIGADYWRGEIEIVALDDAEFRATRGFLMRLEGAENSFLMPVPGETQPQDTTIPSDASLELVSVDVASATLTFSGVGSGAAHAGDKLSYYTASGGYWLGEVVADASPIAGEITIAVTPTPVAPHATTPAPRRLSPLGEWKLTRLEPPMSAVSERRIRFTIEQKVPA